MSRNVREEVVKLIVDGKQVTGSHDELKKAQRGVIKNLKGMEQGTKEYIKESQKLNRINKQLDKVSKGIKGVGQEWKKQKSMWSQAKSTFAGTFAALSVQGAIGKIQQLGFQLINFVKVLTKQRKQITRLTQVTGRDLDVTSSKIQSIVDTFDKGFDETLVAANTLAKSFKLTLPEALEVMQKGFNNGADASGEFLDILKEYPAQLKSAGLSADQSIALITNQVQQGIFSDKGIDAIKEATIRLRELTPATRDALLAIGISSDELEKQLRENSISYFDAIQIISTKLGELPEQSVEVGTALADIFGGAGEDAGIEYIKMLGDVKKSLEDVETPTSKLAEANERLAMTMQRLSDDNGILTQTETRFKNLAADILILTQALTTDLDKKIKQFILTGPLTPLLTSLRDAKNLKEEIFSDQSEPNPLPIDPNAGFNLVDPNKTPGSTSAVTKQTNVPFELESKGMEEVSKAFEEYTGIIEVAEGKLTHAVFKEIEKRRRIREIEAEHMIELQQKQAAQSAFMAATEANTGKERVEAVKNQVTSLIKAYIAEAIAKLIAQTITTSGPLGLFLATGVAATAGALFDTLVPSFFDGGPTGSRSIGFGDKNGPFTGFVHPNEYVIPASQRTDPLIANTETYMEGRRKFGSSGSAATQAGTNVSTEAKLTNTEPLMMAAKMFMDAVIVLQSQPLQSKFSRKEFRNASQDAQEREYNQSKGSLRKR